MKFIFSLLLIVVLMTGCVSPERKLEPALMSQIEEGKTTRVEVERLFGQPRSVITGGNGKTLTLYKYEQAHPNPGWRGVAEGKAGSIVLRGLTVLYGTNQTVEKFLFDQSNTLVRRDRDGILIGWSLSKADFSTIIKGITSRGEIIGWYGAPTMQTLTIDGERMLCWDYVRKTRRFRVDERDQEFRVVFDKDDFVKDFGMFGNTDARTD